MPKVTLDLSGLNKLRKRLKGAENTVIQVGHVEPKVHPNLNMTMAQVGKANHDGFVTPDGYLAEPRPYIRQGLNKRKNIKDLQDSGVKILEGTSTGFKELRKLGPRIKNSIKEDMGDPSKFEGNAPWTLEVKEGRDTPLIDKGHLRRDVKQKLVSKK